MQSSRIPIVPLETPALFPGCTTIVEADREYFERLRNHLLEPGDPVVLVNWDSEISPTPTPDTIRRRGVLARIAELPYDDERVMIAVEGADAVHLSAITVGPDGVLQGQVELVGAPQLRRDQRAG